MKNSKRKRSPSKTRYYAAYKLINKRFTNKINKLTAYVRRNPNDRQANRALLKLTDT